MGHGLCRYSLGLGWILQYAEALVQTLLSAGPLQV